ncbi:ceramide transfer protein isoform X1 [Ixodes scapularis]|uniref:ceramide transfer protein isoform X1 n=1 Tax=Ixodes scapularis TaxID=6945 RepID=UPI001A9FFE4C|nr:ceramide transfer protein isoform X1 [Ixodes scapularis]
MLDDHSINLTDDEDDFEHPTSPLELQGTLCKWTNYIHGWQDRHIVLKDGTLSYYKSENDTAFGCRGAISIYKATVKPHEFDECRFDVSVNDCVWYLRADCLEERNRWVEALDAYKVDSAYGSENSLRRHGSALSLGSTSVSSLKKGRGLREKLSEMETFRDILCRQVDTLQGYFDTCASLAEESAIEDATTASKEARGDEAPARTSDLLPSRLKAHGTYPPVDFRGEAITFKATTAGILATLSHCIDLMAQREDAWKRKLEREVDKRKKLEEGYKQAVSEARSQPAVVLGGPDYEEGPHSMINEEEFYDAIDAALDRNEQQEEERVGRQIKNRVRELLRPSSVASQHPLWSEVEAVTMEQLRYAKMGVGEGGWQLFAEDGEMKMYRREVEEAGVVCDPLKAVHVVRGVTGREVCHYFFSPEVRFDWETTLENMEVLEVVEPLTVIVHQIHKRVWPATQRDALFWSHMARAPNVEDPDAHDVWIVCNHSCDTPPVPLGKCVRVRLTVCLMCQTFVDPPQPNSEITRDNLSCKITYCSTINPGGWAPASVLRAVYKREYPKFLKRFTQYVKDQTECKPILF